MKSRRHGLDDLVCSSAFLSSGHEEVVHMTVDHNETSKGIVQVVDAWFKNALFETKRRQAFLDVQVKAATGVLRTIDRAQCSHDVSQDVHARWGLVTTR